MSEWISICASKDVPERSPINEATVLAVLAITLLLFWCINPITGIPYFAANSSSNALRADSLYQLFCRNDSVATGASLYDAVAAADDVVSVATTSFSSDS